MKLASVFAVAVLAAACASPLSASAASRNSYNWSGYAAHGGGFSSVSGTWTVPAVQPSGSATAGLATWIGIGGANGARDLIQTGTNATVAGKEVTYTAWYELYPDPSVTIQLSVSPGDVVFASVTNFGSDRWLIYLENRSTGASYQNLVNFHSTESSAEWIIERPQTSDGSMQTPLFSEAGFTQMSACKNGTTVSPLSAHADKLTLVSKRGIPLLSPGTLARAGAFTVRAF